MFNEDFQLHPDEKVILYVRKHWIFIAIDFLEILFYFFVPAIFIWVLQYNSLIPDFILFGIAFNSLVNILLYMWGILCWLLFAERFTDFALDFWIVTNKRIVDSELIKLFHRSLSTLELQDIEDISIKTSGFFSSYFAFGDLKVQTAGARNEFDMPKIAHPEYVQRTIFEAKLAADREEKDIEKEEIEQISHRVFNEENLQNSFHIPHDQKVENIDSPSNTFDWARVAERQKNDSRNFEEIIENVEDKYKTDIEEALRNDENSNVEN